MAARSMYFGTRDKMMWIPCPSVGMPRSINRWSEDNPLLNGGTSIRASATGRRIYEMNWPRTSGANLQAIHAYCSGVYGNPPLYFLDPSAMDRNLAPAWLSHAATACDDGPNLAGKTATKPASVTTATNTQDYPLKSAQYTLSGTETPLKLWFPVPAGYTLHIGAHGTTTETAAVMVKPDGASATSLTLLPHNDTVRTNYTQDGPGGAEIYVAGAGVLTLSSVIVQVLPTGRSVAPGGWIWGLGNSGCVAPELPEDIPYSAVLQLDRVAVTLVEVGAWQ